MKRIEKNGLRSTLCGIAACSVLAVSAFAAPLATVKAVAAESDAYWCEDARDRDAYACASADGGYDVDYETNETTEWEPYRPAEIKHSYAVTDFDLTEFVSGYNSVADDDNKLYASGIEYAATVTLIDYNAQGLDSADYASYFDFDGDNGYIVINDANQILDFKTSGDLDYLRDEPELYFGMVDGFVYVDEYGMYQSFNDYRPLEAVECYASDSDTANDNSAEKKIYPGQTAAGDGKIDPNLINEYVTARYPGYTLTKSDFVSNYNEYTLQADMGYYRLHRTSVAVKYNNYLTEGNCVLTAIYNAVCSWSNHNYIDIQDDRIDISVSIKNDPLYVEYTNLEYTTKEKIDDYEEEIVINNKWEVNLTRRLKVMPLVYSEIRNYAVYNHGYKPEIGIYRKDYIDIINHVVNKVNGNNISIDQATTHSSVVVQMFLNQALITSIQNSSTYNNHGVVINGYYEYNKTAELFPGYTVVYSKQFYRLADGHNGKAQIFDPNTGAYPDLLFFTMSRC